MAHPDFWEGGEGRVFRRVG